MKACIIILVMVLGVFSPSWTFASNEESPLVERVRQGDVAALRALLDESYRQKKDLPRAFYYLSLYHKATGRSFFKDDAKAFDELGGLFNNAVMCVYLLDVKFKELEVKKTQLQEEKEKLEQAVERYTKELLAQEQNTVSQIVAYEAVLEEKNKLSTQVSALDAELERVTAEHSKSIATAVDLNKELGECKNTIQALEFEIKALEAANTSLEQAQKTVKELKDQCAILRGEYIDRGREALNRDTLNLEETPAAVGASRGLLTLLMSPLNYLRAPLLAHELILSDPYHTPENKVDTYAGTAILLIPAIAAETIPCAADIVNGFLDFVTFGYYGDEVYGARNSPWWWERTNRTFPWINKY